MFSYLALDLQKKSAYNVADLLFIFCTLIDLSILFFIIVMVFRFLYLLPAWLSIITTVLIFIFLVIPAAYLAIHVAFCIILLPFTIWGNMADDIKEFRRRRKCRSMV